MSEKLPDGWIAHDGRSIPQDRKQPVRIQCRDGICLRSAVPPLQWNARWIWWGSTTKKGHDVVAYLPEPPF
jgi:hypothetical protein